jgi:2-polyprenyl-6-methoxyphenol hydroxylase-like FAD-dependent oxidoreductase
MRAFLTGTFDIAVIGAGPAGLAAACLLAAQGLKVVLFGDDRLHNQQQRLGETLSPTALDALAELDLVQDFLALRLPLVRGFQSTWGSEQIQWRPSTSMARGGGWFLDRRELIALLHQRATGLGVRLLNECVHQVSRCDRSSVVSIQTSDREFKSSLVVYATGRWRAKASPPAKWHVLDKMVACFVVLPAAKDPPDHAVRIDALENGWLYSVSEPSGRRVVALFTDGDLMQVLRSGYSHIVEALPHAPSISEVVSAAELPPHAETTAISASTLFRRFAHGHRWIACGEAAQTLDPLTSQGIASALNDGLDAAHTVVNVLQGDIESALQRETRRRRQFCEYMRTRLGYYHVEQRWPDSRFWKRRSDPSQLRSLVSSFRPAREALEQASWRPPPDDDALPLNTACP